MIKYGILLYQSNKDQVNIEEVIEYFKKASDLGDTDAMVNYAIMLLKREEKPSESTKEEAIKYFKLSIQNGNSSAMYNFAYILLLGKKLDKNIEEAINYYKMAIDNGNTFASILEKMKKLAFNCFKLSQSMGNDVSFHNVGIFYEKGIVTNVDKKEAIKYYEKGFEEGYLNCGCQLGCLLINSDDEKASNFSEGMKYLKIASENGNVDSMYYYCLNIAKKKSTINEIAEMKYYLNKGVYLKDIDLIVLYGNILSQNNYNYPLEQDCVKAAKLYKLSADLGDCDGMMKIAKMLLVGNGIET